MTFTFQTIEVENDLDRDGLLVLRNGTLLAVLVRLSAAHEVPEWTGRWFVEACFGIDGANGKIFDTPDHAAAWLGSCDGSFTAIKNRPAAALDREAALA